MFSLEVIVELKIPNEVRSTFLLVSADQKRTYNVTFFSFRFPVLSFAREIKSLAYYLHVLWNVLEARIKKLFEDHPGNLGTGAMSQFIRAQI